MEGEFTSFGQEFGSVESAECYIGSANSVKVDALPGSPKRFLGMRRVVGRMGQTLSKKRIAAAFLGSRFAHRVWSPVTRGELRILAYHRILDVDELAFPFDQELISASSDQFRRQLHFVRRNFNVVSFEDLARCEDEGRRWPDRALIITFDDGYRDNYTHAFPILKEMQMPATIFLATGHIGQAKLFWWDMVAYCIKHTPRRSARLAEISTALIPLANYHERRDAVQKILRWLKQVPEESKNAFLARLPTELDVKIPADRAEGMHLSWDEIREMVAGGIRFGSHTVTHPILSNVTPAQLKDEVVESHKALERELGQPPITFSYPVGGPTNYNASVQKCVAAAGFRYAVSYEEGIPTSDVCDRFALTRLHVESHDAIRDFKAKLMFPALMVNRS